MQDERLLVLQSNSVHSPSWVCDYIDWSDPHVSESLSLPPGLTAVSENLDLETL